MLSKNKMKLKKTKKNNLILIGILILLIVILFFSLKPSRENIKLTEETKEFNITAKKWEFSPDKIEVNKGDKVILNIKSVDVSHGISLVNFKINEFLEPNQEIKIEFIADKKGRFNFFCNVFCGSGHSGMNGVLVVR